MHDFKLYNALVTKLTQQLVGANHRQLVLITGNSAWCYRLVNSFITNDNTAALSKSEALKNAIWPSHNHQILGKEFNDAVYDGFSGLHPDKLAALAGTVKAGGILFLMLPTLNSLDTWPDPALASIESFGHNTSQSLFNKRFSSIIHSLPALHFSELNGVTSNIKPSPSNTINYQPQQNCVEQIVKVANGRANRPLLINADRGRGKSAALGLSAAQLSDKKIILCATQFSATHSSFKHLANALNVNYDPTQKQLANLSYMPPDALLNSLPECDLLLVDEAAAIPVPLLLKILTHYPKVVFASTLVGYEGNGRGYTIRFSKYVKAHYKAAKVVTLDEPLRFAKHDPLEQHIRTLLALDAQFSETNCADISALTHREISQQSLINDELLLRQVIALLAQAHYQSSVNDLRHLLDAPAQRIFISEEHNRLVAVCLIAIEGDIDTDIAELVISGERRPQGHLMAQTLAQLSFSADFLTQLSARVVRIAVDPSAHNLGLGKALIGYCELKLKPQCKFFGASFGATAPLLNFWQSEGFVPVKLGFKKDKSTAEHSVLVIKPLHDGCNKLDGLSKQFQNEFMYGLLTHFKTIHWQLVSILLNSFSDEPLTPHALFQLTQFRDKSLNRFSVSAVVWHAINKAPSNVRKLNTPHKQLIIQSVLQNYSDEQLLKQFSLTGKKQLDNSLSSAFKSLIAQFK